MAYVKSAFWLLCSGAIGYTLLLVTTPDQKIIKEKYPELASSEAEKKRKLIVETLRLAAENKNPMYRQTKEEIEQNLQLKK